MDCTGCRYEKTCNGALRGGISGCRPADREPWRKIELKSVPPKIAEKYNLRPGMIINGALVK